MLTFLSLLFFFFKCNFFLTSGELCISENERRLVSKEAWSKLQQYFPKAPEFPSYKECCSQCKILEREGEENEALHKMIANEQKTSLPNLFQDKNRPCLSNWPEVSWSPARTEFILPFSGFCQSLPPHTHIHSWWTVWEQPRASLILFCLVLSYQGDLL